MSRSRVVELPAARDPSRKSAMSRRSASRSLRDIFRPCTNAPKPSAHRCSSSVANMSGVFEFNGRAAPAVRASDVLALAGKRGCQRAHELAQRHHLVPLAADRFQFWQHVAAYRARQRTHLMIGQHNRPSAKNVFEHQSHFVFLPTAASASRAATPICCRAIKRADVSSSLA